LAVRTLNSTIVDAAFRQYGTIGGTNQHRELVFRFTFTVQSFANTFQRSSPARVNLVGGHCSTTHSNLPHRPQYRPPLGSLSIGPSNPQWGQPVSILIVPVFDAKLLKYGNPPRSIALYVLESFIRLIFKRLHEGSHHAF
jgi:hypothetical protein